MKLTFKATKKDWIFTIVAALVLGNLGLSLAQTAGALIVFPGSATLWAYCIAGMLGIVGLIWWMRTVKVKLNTPKPACIKCERFPSCPVYLAANAKPITFYCAGFEAMKLK